VKLRLVCQDKLAYPREIAIDQFPVELGRGQMASVRIDDRWLSRRHCRLELDPQGGLFVRDLGSRHGTFVNGRQITESKLAPGDELCIGLSHFLAEFEPDSAVALVPAPVLGLGT
jgi:pSer/pThr/pTyr-binding forkhead associated (FHA) protein